MLSPNKSIDGAIGGPISLAKVRNIVKLSSDVSCIGTAQCVLLAKVADLFTSDLVHAAYLRSTTKTIDYHDVCEVVHQDDHFDFVHPLIPKTMKYSEYKQWVAKRGDDPLLQPSVDPGASQNTIKKKVIKKNKVVKNKVKQSAVIKSGKKVTSPTLKKPTVVNGDNKKKPPKEKEHNNGIKKYFVKVDK